MTKTVTRLTAISLALLLAVATFSLYTFQASADWDGGKDRGNDGDRTEIELGNEDTKVTNRVSVTANTGGNSADGGDSGQGGGQKPPPRGGLNLVMPSFGGQSGSAGPGGDGGRVVTGNADAYGTLYNDANSNYVVVEGCGCDEEEQYGHPFMQFFKMGDDGKVLKIEAENEDTEVDNELDVRANTGRNSANGGDSRGGGSSFSPWTMWFGHHMSDNGGGDAGVIRTGKATAEGHLTNYANTNIVRVLKGQVQDEEEPAPDQS